MMDNQFGPFKIREDFMLITRTEKNSEKNHRKSPPCILTLIKPKMPSETRDQLSSLISWEHSTIIMFSKILISVYL